MPSELLASSRPLLANALNERSLRPPMSVTSPTLIFLPAGLAAVDVEAAPALLDVVLLSLLPQAATAKLPMARMRAIGIARYGLRCTAPPCNSSRSRHPQAPANGGNLQRPGASVAQPGQKVVAQRGLGEARLDGRTGDSEQVLLAQTEVLMGDRIFARDARAEVRRVVGAERERDPRLAQDREGVRLVGGEDPEDDVARRA